ADANEADSKKQFQAGWRELGNAKDEVFGGDTTAQRVPKAKGGGAKGGGAGAPGWDRGQPGSNMLPDCKIVRGKVPGPANHVLCATHGHVVDIATKTVLASSLEQYKKMYGPGGSQYTPPQSKGGGGGGSYPRQSTEPPGKQKHGVSSKDVPDYETDYEAADS